MRRLFKTKQKIKVLLKLGIVRRIEKFKLNETGAVTNSFFCYFRLIKYSTEV